jgi:deoxyribonuclease (pyrimidine dimer)
MATPINQASTERLRELNKKYPNGNVPKKFSLNTGHISFFRDKAEYLFIRLSEIHREMVERGMKVNKGIISLLNENKIPEENFNDWMPGANDKNIVIERILERIKNPKKKKTPYHYKKMKITYTSYNNFLLQYNAIHAASVRPS